MATTETAPDAQIIEMSDRYVMSIHNRAPVVFARGEGAYLWDVNGKKYLDFLAGIAVNGLGHCHPKVVAALREQAGILWHTCNLYYHELQPKLAKMLVELSDFDKCFFCNSGAEANEAAIKIARKWAKVHHGDEKFEIITALDSFHGRTLAAITATGQPKYQKAFAPLPPGFRYVPYNDAEALRQAVGESTCAIMLEPVQGESGVHPATREYLETARALCDDKGLLLIFDEVQTGMGRTGRFWAYEHYGVVPDVATLAKSLAGGFPMGACLARGEAAETFQPGDHASTFGGNALACAAAIATLSAIGEEKLVENARAMGEYLRAGLSRLQAEVGGIEEIRGLGLMAAMDLATPTAAAFASKCLASGLIVNPIPPKTIRFLPPLIIERKHVDEAIGILTSCLEEVK